MTPPALSPLYRVPGRRDVCAPHITLLLRVASAAHHVAAAALRCQCASARPAATCSRLLDTPWPHSIYIARRPWMVLLQVCSSGVGRAASAFALAHEHACGEPHESSKNAGNGHEPHGPMGDSPMDRPIGSDPMASVQGGVLMIVFLLLSCRQPQQQVSPLMMAPFHHIQ